MSSGPHGCTGLPLPSQQICVEPPHDDGTSNWTTPFAPPPPTSPPRTAAGFDAIVASALCVTRSCAANGARFAAGNPPGMSENVVQPPHAPPPEHEAPTTMET